MLHTRFIVMKGWFNWLITLIVAFNCVVLASAGYPSTSEEEKTLDDLNFVCTIIFTVEMVMKMFALGFKGYASEAFNVFDGFIVLISFVEMFLPNGAGISVFRSLRILRIAKLTASFQNFRRVITTIMSVIPELTNFFFLLLFFTFFFAVMGLHLFGGTMSKLEELPRSNYDSFSFSIMCTFQILTGENWNTLMFDVMETNGSFAVVYFVVVIVIGGFMMLNLFLAVLLLKTMRAFKPPFDIEKDLVRLNSKRQLKEDAMDADMASTATRPPTDLEIEFTLEGNSCFILGPKSSFRQMLRALCVNPVFDAIILLCIVVSSLALAFEEPDTHENILFVLKYMDYGFTSIFTFEMTIKIIALKFAFGSSHAYCKNPWNVLDGLIVVASLVSILFVSMLGDIGWVSAPEYYHCWGFLPFVCPRVLKVEFPAGTRVPSAACAPTSARDQTHS